MLITDRDDKGQIRKTKAHVDFNQDKNHRPPKIYKFDGTDITNNNNKTKSPKKTYLAIQRSTKKEPPKDHYLNIDEVEELRMEAQPKDSKFQNNLPNSGYKRLKDSSVNQKMRYTAQDKSFMRLTKGTNYKESPSPEKSLSKSLFKKNEDQTKNKVSQVKVASFNLLNKLQDLANTHKENINNPIQYNNSFKVTNKENNLSKDQKQRRVEFSFNNFGSSTQRSKEHSQSASKQASNHSRKIRLAAKSKLRGSIERLHGRARENQEKHALSVIDANSTLFNLQLVKDQTVEQPHNVKNLIDILDMKMRRTVDEGDKSSRKLNHIYEGSSPLTHHYSTRKLKGQLNKHSKII